MDLKKLLASSQEKQDVSHHADECIDEHNHGHSAKDMTILSFSLVGESSALLKAVMQARAHAAVHVSEYHKKQGRKQGVKVSSRF